jgi:Rad3-related DNA helicase
VIRHKRDFGAVLLCDERFARWKAPGSAALSKWILPSLQARTQGGAGGMGVDERQAA